MSTDQSFSHQQLFERIEREVSNEIPYETIYSVVDYEQEKFSSEEVENIIAALKNKIN